MSQGFGMSRRGGEAHPAPGDQMHIYGCVVDGLTNEELTGLACTFIHPGRSAADSPLKGPSVRIRPLLYGTTAGTEPWVEATFFFFFFFFFFYIIY